MRLEHRGNKFILSFPYNEQLVSRVRALPTAKWNKAERVWEFKATRGVLDALHKEFGVGIDGMGKAVVVDMSRYQFRTMPYQHQRDAILRVFEQFGFKVKQ